MDTYLVLLNPSHHSLPLASGSSGEADPPPSVSQHYHALLPPPSSLSRLGPHDEIQDMLLNTGEVLFMGQQREIILCQDISKVFQVLEMSRERAGILSRQHRDKITSPPAVHIPVLPAGPTP